MTSAVKERKELFEKLNEYLAFAENLKTADDIREIVSRADYNELEQILLNRLTFGTAGLRGRMGPGYAAMNDLVIVQTSQGLASYLEEITPKEDKMKGVVIGFDNRHNSHRFAKLAAVSFLLKNFKVYIFSVMTPTPFVPFAVKKLGCLVGIMVTASHNPKNDNGYKVYWSNGAQILSPHDKNIQESILKNLKPWDSAFDVSLVGTSNLAFDPLVDIHSVYFLELIRSIHKPHLFQSCPLRITFTALHGVSHAYMKKAFQLLNYKNFIAVKEQMDPDPDFPTVYFPNPEERNCLDIPIATADSHYSKFILANDPDADRLAVAEKLPNGEWYIYTGNQIGALLGAWLWYIAPMDWKAKPENCFMVSSTVSSKILRSIAAKEGFVFYETLTGFKWMANKAYDAMNKGMNFIFAFEEAIGYMCGSTVLDKDGIQAAMQVASMFMRCYSQNMILYDMLRDTYLKYGYHVSCNSYFICNDPEKMKKMFDRIRNYQDTNKYPEVLEDETQSFPIKAVRDLTTGYDSSQPDNKAILPTSSSTQMITFYFENGCEATIRTSGTEPKIKYYTEMIAEEPEENWCHVDAVLKEVVRLIINKLIQPEENGFCYRPT